VADLGSGVQDEEAEPPPSQVPGDRQGGLAPDHDHVEQFVGDAFLSVLIEPPPARGRRGS
jgi:hypothetical protein